MASLYVIRGRDQGKTFQLRSSSITLGRDEKNTIQLRDTEVSRHHAKIDAPNSGNPAAGEAGNDGRYLIIDTQSSNGTFVNGTRVEQHWLRSGDRVQLGGTLMIFTGGPEPATLVGNHGVDIVRQVDPLELSSIRSSLPFASSRRKAQPPAPAISNTQTPSNSNDWEIIYWISQAVSRTLDIDQLLNHILDLIFGWIQCDRGCIMLIDEETGHLQPANRRNRKSHSTSDRIEISKTILDYVIEHKEGVLTSNARSDQRWEAAASIVQAGIREAICVPMQGRYGVVGAIYVDTTRTHGSYVESGQANLFTEDHLRLMVTIGHQAALAIEDTSYYRAMVQSERLAAMGQTIATLSHHIKNILQGIRGGSYLVEEGLKNENPEVIRKGWRIVDKNQERISSLVMDMLTFSKERQPEWMLADVRETIQDVVELAQTRAREANVNLIWQAPADFPQCRLDPEAMHRAILNVLGNAIDATESVSEGCVRVELACDRATQQVSIAVIDNGIGIKPDDLQKIFSVFESRKGNRGTGLGLPVSQKILREHHGEIEVSSVEGEGTTFKLVWPGLPTSDISDGNASPTMI